MTHDQLHNPFTEPAVDTTGGPANLHDLLEQHVEREFTMSDRGLFEMVRREVEVDGLQFGSVTPAQTPDVSHRVHALVAKGVNIRFDALEKIPHARVIENPTPEEAAASERALERQRIEHAKSRRVPLPEGYDFYSFPPQTIDRYVDEFYKDFGVDRYHPDAILRDRFEEALQKRQEIIFPDGQVPSPAQQRYDSRPTELSPLAAHYPQIALYVRVRNMFRSLGLDREADGMEVDIAACGKRLTDRGYKLGSSLVNQTIVYDFESHKPKKEESNQPGPEAA